ncbi:uncharacterized protein HMPREF1120_05879 [Exophiala dermatitidis NIH/UT8656]|uniref:Uncharacterized protein n=1 Tax=Exophiala dermatitidis (strain ATCC 34100 / CBS 525.76 / NIH/UT8656) TaxID=858893 RepID=H6C229_EXODN|nr:uncharacterized protein HMPREF1120_05879 [Exophiala dermatitidis NIH/UT8656]EHY57855.1 hypothetical protein HMPREF1120_05879 [Exophiala dermatitidis NIH/UT8656]
MDGGSRRKSNKVQRMLAGSIILRAPCNRSPLTAGVASGDLLVSARVTTCTVTAVTGSECQQDVINLKFRLRQLVPSVARVCTMRPARQLRPTERVPVPSALSAAGANA